ncbi:hypothetical protein Tco_1228853 [Tanacetum coccineum]
MGRNRNDVLEALLHNTIAQDMIERPQNDSLENDTLDLINDVTKAQRLNLFILENVKILDHDKYSQNVMPLNLYEITPKMIEHHVYLCSDYDLWSMRMEQYLTHTDYALWEVIMNGDAPAIASASTEGPIPPKTAEQKLARKNELKAKSTMLLAIPDEHLLKFHGIKDAKTLWEAIKARTDKNYDRFQKLISQLEIHGEVISQEDANLKLLRSLPSAWNNIALIMHNKADLDELSMDDLYNNLKVYEDEIKSQSSSSSNSQNVAFEIYPVELYNALVVQDGIGGFMMGASTEEGPTDFALMAHLSSGSSSSSSSDSELAEALKEKDDLKLKLEKFETSSMKLTKLINSQISVNNKSGVGFDSQMNENELHDCHLNKSEVFESASDSSVNEIEEENNQVNDRFKKVEGYHAVPPPYTGNYMPSRPDLSFARLDDYVYKTNVSETISSVPRIESTASKSSKDSLEQPKDVRPSAPIIEEWESDSDDDCVIRPSIEQNKPSYAKINFVKSDENTRKSVIKQHTYRQAENLRKSQSPRVDKRNWNGIMTRKLGNGFEFNKKACFVCGSLNHLIKDYNFYENKMVGKYVLNNMRRITGQREVRPVWNNAQRNYVSKVLGRNQGDDLMPTIEEGEVIEEFRTRDEDLDTGIDDYPSYCDDDKKIHIDCAHNLKFSCMIGFEFTHVNFYPLLYVNVMSKEFHNSIMKDKMVYKGDNVVGALMNVPIFVGTFSVMTDFAVLEDMDAYRDERMGNIIAD